MNRVAKTGGAVGVAGIVGAGLVLALSDSEHKELKAFERTVLTAYPDPATKNHPVYRGKPWTICSGATGTIYYDGKAVIVQPGLTLTAEQCQQVDDHIAETYRAGLERCVTRRLNQSQSDALIIHAVNVGVPTACKGSVVRNVNAGKWQEAADAMLLYSCARTNDLRYPEAHCGPGRRQMPGLLRRRQYEAKLLLKPALSLPQPVRDRMLEAQRAELEAAQ